jgi:hypothetical protein
MSPGDRSESTLCTLFLIRSLSWCDHGVHPVQEISFFGQVCF